MSNPAIKRWRVMLAAIVAIEILAPAFSVGQDQPSPPPSTPPPSATPPPSSPPPTSSAPTPSSAPELKTEGDRQKEAEELKRLQEFYLRNQSVFILERQQSALI